MLLPDAAACAHVDAGEDAFDNSLSDYRSHREAINKQQTFNRKRWTHGQYRQVANGEGIEVTGLR